MTRRSPGGRLSLALLLSAVIAIAAGLSGVSAQATDTAASGNPYFENGAEPGSGEGKRIGYISLGEDAPFVALVTEGIRAQAELAGAELIVCDSRFDPEEALVCARQMAALDVDGILNFQPSADDAGRICTAHGNLPTIAIDIPQQPCERSFVGADNHRAGLLTGTAVGEHMRNETDCRYDSVLVLQFLGGGPAPQARTQGALDGFEEVCGPVADDQLRVIDVAGTYDQSFELMAGVLPDVQEGGIHIVLAINDLAARGTSDAARSLGRADELRIGAQGAEATKQELACQDHWIAATAFFPERYGHILIPAMTDLLDEKDVPAELLVPHVAVTKDNVHSLFDDVLECDAA
jgi:ribose transport system substrate-binding protein